MSVPLSESSQTQATLPRPHVVVVHADVDLLNLIRELLVSERYYVTATTFVEGVIPLITAMQPSLIVLDLQYGKVVGWDMLVSLTDAVVTRNLPVLVTSTDQEFLDRARTLSQRYADRRFVLEPFELETLLRAVNELIGQPSHN